VGKVLFIDYERCIGCRSCLAACRECGGHEGRERNYVVQLAPGITTQTAPMLCLHCENPACARSCPAEAIKVTPEGVVLAAAREKCLGCKNCTLACPYGIPRFDESQNLMMKCDLCYERTSAGSPPMCASVCPAETLSWVDEEVARERVARRSGGRVPRDFNFKAKVITTAGLGGWGAADFSWEGVLQDASD